MVKQQQKPSSHLVQRFSCGGFRHVEGVPRNQPPPQRERLPLEAQQSAADFPQQLHVACEPARCKSKPIFVLSVVSWCPCHMLIGCR